MLEWATTKAGERTRARRRGGGGSENWDGTAAGRRRGSGGGRKRTGISFWRTGLGSESGRIRAD
jgi:hypothetical protein